MRHRLPYAKLMIWLRVMTGNEWGDVNETTFKNKSSKNKINGSRNRACCIPPSTGNNDGRGTQKDVKEADDKIICSAFRLVINSYTSRILPAQDGSGKDKDEGEGEQEVIDARRIEDRIGHFRLTPRTAIWD